jgi:hypothetical protein
MNIPPSALALCMSLVASTACAADVSSDVRRLHIERDRQQLDLRLKMQQQQDRALAPLRAPVAEQRRGALEREQVQRQEQLLTEEARELSVTGPVEDAASAARRQIQQDRAEHAVSGQLQRFEAERRRW